MNKIIRVLNIQETVGSGGVERIRVSLAKLLDKDLFELKIVCTQTKGPVADEIRSHGVEVIPVGLLTNPLKWEIHKKVQKIIDEFKPDIIHGAVFEGVTLAAINGFIKRVPIIILEETSDPMYTRPWRGNMLMKLFSLVSDKVIGVSPASVEYLKHKLKLPDNKVQLINNGVAQPRFVSEEEIQSLRNELGILPNEIIIGSIGRMLLDSNKRFSDLIKAFALLVKKGLSVKLLLVGEGPELKGYKQLVESLEITNKVVFGGFQHDTARYYSIMDVFSLVSAREAFGLVLAEAMLHRLPVVATRIGGMKYIVDHEKTGFLVESKNIPEISEKLETLCLNEELRNDMGLLGYQKALKEYTEEQYVATVQKMYFELSKIKRII